LEPSVLELIEDFASIFPQELTATPKVAEDSLCLGLELFRLTQPGEPIVLLLQVGNDQLQLEDLFCLFVLLHP